MSHESTPTWTLCAATPNTGVPVGEFVWYRTLKLPSRIVHIETIDSMPRTGEWRRPGTDAPVIVINGDDGSERDEPDAATRDPNGYPDEHGWYRYRRAPGESWSIVLRSHDPDEGRVEWWQALSDSSSYNCHDWAQEVGPRAEFVRLDVPGSELCGVVTCVVCKGATSERYGWRRAAWARQDQLDEHPTIETSNMDGEIAIHTGRIALVHVQGWLFWRPRIGAPRTTVGEFFGERVMKAGGSATISTVLVDDARDPWIEDLGFAMLAEKRSELAASRAHAERLAAEVKDLHRERDGLKIELATSEVKRATAELELGQLRTKEQVRGELFGPGYDLSRDPMAHLDFTAIVGRQARTDLDDKLPTTEPGPLDDPRMDGERWIDVDDITQAMIGAWPGLWEVAFLEHGELPHVVKRMPVQSSFEWAGGERMRPLRLPDMGLDGVVFGDKMTPEHLARCRWGVMCTGSREYEQENYTDQDLDGDPTDRWRPVGWPTETADQQRTKRVHDNVMAELAEKWTGWCSVG